MFKNVLTAFNKKNVRKLFLPFAIILGLTLLSNSAFAAEDLLASGNDTVKATIGKDSSLIKWIMMFEVLAGMWLYIKTKNIPVLLGFAILVVIVNIAFTII